MHNYANVTLVADRQRGYLHAADHGRLAIGS
jgi:hypothetical protein